MSWVSLLSADPLPWLLEPDDDNPGVRYFALRDLLDRPSDDSELQEARRAVMLSGPVPAILDAQYPEGYWMKPGSIYSPKYRSTVWQVLFLAQLGADGLDERVRRAADYVMDQSQADSGAFAMNARPSGTVHCLWGNLTRALLELGYWEDERLQRAAEALARSVTGDGYEWYRRSGVQQPGFYCSANYDLPCGWGAVRVLWALNRVPPNRRTPVVRAAIERGVGFLLSHDVARADYPYKERISSSWFKLGYPLGYVTDVLLNLEALAEAGCGGDPRLSDATDLVLSKQDADGRWKMEYSYNGKMWADVEEKGQPSKWVTLRAARALKMIEECAST
jgi:hypothetical protein